MGDSGLLPGEPAVQRQIIGGHIPRREGLLAGVEGSSLTRNPQRYPLRSEVQCQGRIVATYSELRCIDYCQLRLSQMIPRQILRSRLE